MDPRPWITFTSSPGGNNLSYFEPTNRTRTILAQRAKPSYITFTGKRSKTILLDKLLGDGAVVPVHTQTYLWSAQNLTRNNNPVWIIDCNAQNKPGITTGTEEDYRLSKTWSAENLSNPSAMLCGKIFSQFSSVVCCFVSDLGGPRGVANWLADFVLASPTFDVPILPRILLVAETMSNTFDESRATDKAIHHFINAVQEKKGAAIAKLPSELQTTIKRVIGRIEIVGLLTAETHTIRARMLKHRLLTMSAVAMRERAEASMQFKLVHFFELTKKALGIMCHDASEPMCLASITRPIGYSSDLFEQCLTDFLRQMPTQAWLWHFAAPIIGSALLLASYPPGSHEFDPDYLFQQLYLKKCHSAIQQYVSFTEIHDKFIQSVRQEFRKAFNCLQLSLATKRPASQLHYKNLSSNHVHLTRFKSNRSCFCCFQRMPEKVLICGHALCDPCIKTFGVRSRHEKNTFEVPECILCGVKYHTSVFKFVPPTAGIRVLSVDGGGIKGIIPLMFLSHVDMLLAPMHFSIRDCFDLVCGTSAGGLVVIGLFLLQWSATESINRFEEVASKTFGKRKAFIARILQLFIAYAEDGQYSLDAVQDAFRKTFNSPLQMFNPLRNDTKVAVTTTAVKDSLPWLFTNYNGGKRSHDSGYDVVRAEKAHHDVTISDAACCTSAAPWFFKPQLVKKLGSFQDGGLQHNNPANMAQWEMKFVWPTKAEPDFALSLGTGTSPPLATKSFTTPRFYVRLFQSFMRNLDGEDAWKRFFNSLPTSIRSRFHRLNITFDGPEPGLDDVTKIPELKDKVSRTIYDTPSILDATLDSIYASMFYFELTDVTLAETGGHYCTGTIFCRLDLPTDGLRYLYNRLYQTNSHFLILGRPIKCVDGVPVNARPFCRYAVFHVEKMEDVVSITIRGITKTQKSISGFPTTTERLMEVQQLEHHFGTVDHAEDEKILPAVPSKRTCAPYQNLIVDKKQRHR